MKTIKTIVLALLITTGSVYFANAQARVHVGINTPGLHVNVGNRPYYHRAYYAAPVAYRPYYRPYYRRPVVVYRHAYYAHPVYHRVYRRW